PRDGSAREPSVLVADLLAAADAQHAPEAKAGEALVVRHTLQPFAPAAFGSEDEPRRFSYHAQWWPAAAQPAQKRVALPAWFGDGAWAAMTDGSGSGDSGASTTVGIGNGNPVGDAVKHNAAQPPQGGSEDEATLSLDEL